MKEIVNEEDNNYNFNDLDEKSTLKSDSNTENVKKYKERINTLN